MKQITGNLSWHFLYPVQEGDTRMTCKITYCGGKVTCWFGLPWHKIIARQYDRSSVILNMWLLRLSIPLTLNRRGETRCHRSCREFMNYDQKWCTSPPYSISPGLRSRAAPYLGSLGNTGSRRKKTKIKDVESVTVSARSLPQRHLFRYSQQDIWVTQSQCWLVYHGSGGVKRPAERRRASSGNNSMWDPSGWFLWQNLTWPSIPSNLKGGGSVFLLFSHTVYEITADSPLTNSIIWEGFVVFMTIPSFRKFSSDPCCCHRNMKNLQGQGFSSGSGSVLPALWFPVLLALHYIHPPNQNQNKKPSYFWSAWFQTALCFRPTSLWSIPLIY